MKGTWLLLDAVSKLRWALWLLAFVCGSFLFSVGLPDLPLGVFFIVKLLCFGELIAVFFLGMSAVGKLRQYVEGREEYVNTLVKNVKWPLGRIHLHLHEKHPSIGHLADIQDQLSRARSFVYNFEDDEEEGFNLQNSKVNSFQIVDDILHEKLSQLEASLKHDPSLWDSTQLLFLLDDLLDYIQDLINLKMVE